jgi:hypothetical protein
VAGAFDYGSGVLNQSDSVGTGASAAPGRGFRGPPLALLVALGATLVIRSLQLVAIAIASTHQAATGPVNPAGSPARYFVFSPSPASPGLGAVLANWDGQWYERIATMGYPPAAAVQSANDAWTTAFPPGFPLLARAVMEVSGLSFAWASLLLNTILTLLAVALLYGILRSQGVPDRLACAAAIGISLLPSAPVLLASYSEALALVLLLLALRLLLVYRYVMAAVVVLCLSFTRPIAVAFVLVLLVHATTRWLRQPRTVARGEWLGMGAVLASSSISPWVWPQTAALLFGVPDGTQYAGSDRTEQIVAGLGGYVGAAWSAGGVPLVITLLLCLCVLVGVPALLSHGMGWPVELSIWGASYIGLVVIATPVTPGFLRYLVLAAPLLVAVFAAPLARLTPIRVVAFAGLVSLSLWFQWFWIRYLFILDPAPELLPWAP